MGDPVDQRQQASPLLMNMNAHLTADMDDLAVARLWVSSTHGLGFGLTFGLVVDFLRLVRFLEDARDAMCCAQ